MIPRCCSLPVKRFFIPAQRGQQRFYSSSYHGRSSSSGNSSSSSSNSNNNRKSEEPDSELPPADNANVQQQPPPAAQRLAFMPVVNMPESEFAHNAFFSLHRPLLGLSSADEQPFFSTRSHLLPINNQTIRDILGISQHSQDIDTDDAVAQYMAHLKPFEPPHKEHNHHYRKDSKFDNDMDELLPSSADDLEVGFDAGDGYLDQSLPMYYMPESEQVVDYLTAMQDKLARQHGIEEEPEEGVSHVGRKRGSNRPVIYAATSEEAKRKAMLTQQYRQRTRRQRPINRLLIARKTR